MNKAKELRGFERISPGRVEVLCLRLLCIACLCCCLFVVVVVELLGQTRAEVGYLG